jgi:hypothetical protein
VNPSPSVNLPDFRRKFDSAQTPLVAQNALGVQPGVHVQVVDTNRTAIVKLKTATAALNFPEIAAAGTEVLTIAVTGAATGDAVHIGVPTAAINAGVIYWGYVSAADTVTVVANNITAGPINPASGTFRAVVMGF